VEVRATGDSVRILDGSAILAVHRRVWGKGMQVEDPAHLAELVARKRGARKERGMDRLHHALPRTKEFLQRLAERGSNLGSATAGLLRLLDTHGAVAVDAALAEALEHDAPHLGAVRHALDRALHAAGKPPPMGIALSEKVRARDALVRPHPLSTYDRIGQEDDDHDA